MKSIFREPVNGFTHLFGAVLSLIGLIMLLIFTVKDGNFSILKIIACIVFGISLILLYLASSVYHLVIASEKVLSILRKVDHSMIYILIAGTYTPICLVALNGYLRWGYLIAIWSLAMGGVLFKLIWFKSPRWISTVLYIVMGWLAIFALVPLYYSLSLNGFLWLLFGGISYTVGAIFYGLKKPIIIKNFGFHEIFHVFVMLGSLCHYWVVFRYIV